MTSETNHHFRPVEQDRWTRIAALIEEDPQCLDVALENLDRWEKWGRTHPGPIREWRTRILGAQSDPGEFAGLLNYLREDNAGSEPLKNCSPFAGLEGAGRA